MATRMHCTDLVLLWHEHRPNPWATCIYRPPHLLHRSTHDIVCLLYTVTSYLIPWPSARTVTVCRVITYAPGRALFPQFHSSVPKLCSKALFQSSVPKLRSKAPFQSYDPTPGGILTPVLRQCRPSPVKSLHVKSSPFKPPSWYPPLRVPVFNELIYHTASVLSFISWL